MRFFFQHIPRTVAIQYSTLQYRTVQYSQRQLVLYCIFGPKSCSSGDSSRSTGQLDIHDLFELGTRDSQSVTEQRQLLSLIVWSIASLAISKLPSSDSLPEKLYSTSHLPIHLVSPSRSTRCFQCTQFVCLCLAIFCRRTPRLVVAIICTVPIIWVVWHRKVCLLKEHLSLGRCSAKLLSPTTALTAIINNRRTDC